MPAPFMAQKVIRDDAEELNITESLTHLSTFYSRDEPYRHMFGLFCCTVGNEWEFMPNDEVDEVIPMPLGDIIELMAREPDRFTGGFLNTMKEYVRVLGEAAIRG